MQGLGNWTIVKDTPGVDHIYFIQYRNLQEGLITSVVMHLNPLYPAMTQGSIYFCVVCKKERSEEMSNIFENYIPNQKIEKIPLRIRDEIGFITWMTKEYARTSLIPILDTICSEEVLKEQKVPQSIGIAFQERLDNHLGKE